MDEVEEGFFCPFDKKSGIVFMIQKIFPFLRWFPLRVGVLRADFIAGMTVALVLVPQSMAYAQLAGVPAYYGLYAALLPVITAALFGSSSQLSTGPVAIVALLTASTLSVFAVPKTEEFVILAIFLAFLVGVIQILLGILRIGVMMNFLAHPVIVGFTNAAALIIGFSQLNKILGVPMQQSDSYLSDIWKVFLLIPEAHLPTLCMGIAAFIAMFLLKKFVPKVPGVLIVVAVSIMASFLIGFSSHFSGNVVGTIPQGLPGIAFPRFDWHMVMNLFSAALVIALIGFMEAISIAKAISAKTHESIDPNQELIGQGLANITGSFIGSFPVGGSFSRSAVNFSAGAKTSMSSIFTGLFVLLTLLFLTPFLYHLPQAVLAAVIMMAVVGLVNIKSMMHLWETHRSDGLAAFATFFATVFFAPHLDNGILFGGVLAILLFFGRISRPRVFECIPDKTMANRRFVESDGAVRCPQILVLKIEGSLFFASVSNIEKDFETFDNGEKARVILCRNVNFIDTAGAEFLVHEKARLERSGRRMILVGLREPVKQILKRGGFLKTIGVENIFASKQDAIKDAFSSLDTSACTRCQAKFFLECKKL